MLLLLDLHPHPHPHTPMKELMSRRCIRIGSGFSFPSHPIPLILSLIVALLGACEKIRAQTSSPNPTAVIVTPDSGTGTVAGVVLNPSTGAYVANAEVRVEGTNLLAVTDRQGAFRLDTVPAGPATITVTFTGYTTVREALIVRSGETITREINIKSALADSQAGDGTVKLQKYVVASQREGSAKAIMDQRNSIDIKNSVSSDSFGDFAEGNIGEFLRHLPGVDFDLTQGEIRYVRLRGLGTEYTGMTVDGGNLAVADGNLVTSADSRTRAFTMEQVSLASIESIEVSKTISADVDANAPAGTINLKSKRAFDRAGRRISWQTNLIADSTAVTLGKTWGPDERRRAKILPGASFDYSDIFFDRRLGIALSASESNAYNAFYNRTFTNNFAATAADPRPVVPTSISIAESLRTTRRAAYSLTLDYKATPSLVLSLSTMFNLSQLLNYQRSVGFSTGPRNTVVGANPLTSLTTNSTAAQVSTGDSGFSKLGETLTVTPKFEYKRENLVINGRFTLSDSLSVYGQQGHDGGIYNIPVSLAGITFRAERSTPMSSDWKVTQLAGPDMSSGAGFVTGNPNNGAGRVETYIQYLATTKLYTGDVTAELKTNTLLPIQWKAGLKTKIEKRSLWGPRQLNFYSYIGPGAGTGEWAAYPSPTPFNTSPTNASITTLTPGKGVFIPNLVAIGKLYREHPEHFALNMQPAGYYSQVIATKRDWREDIDAAFAMATADVGKLKLRAGVRWEETTSDALQYDPRTRAEVLAAGFPVDASGRATTIPGLQYQYLSKPRVHEKGTYDNLFPSASLKYPLSRSLDFQLGFSSTIRRPTLSAISGILVVNEQNLSVTVPNPRLTPERSKNFSMRTAYYFEPVGMLALNLFQNNVTGLHRTSQLTAAEYGYVGEQDLSAYTFNTTTQGAGETIVRGMEIEYSQSLSFLPHPFKGLNIRGSYTRNYAQVIFPSMAPHAVNGGFSYSINRLNVYFNANWSANVPTNTTGTGYRRHRINTDIGGSFRIYGPVALFFNARNMLNDPLITMDGTLPAQHVASAYQVNGRVYTMGLKGSF